MKYETRDNNELEEIMENVDEKAQEIFNSYEDDYDDEINLDNKKLKRTKLIVNIVFTIIVLLILATVTISIVINGGIITRAKNATTVYNEKATAENATIKAAEDNMAAWESLVK